MTGEINDHWRSRHLPTDRRDQRRDHIRDVVVEHVDAENAADMGRVLATYTEPCVFHDVPTAVVLRGKDAIAASYQQRFDAFPDMTRTITRLTVDDHGAVAEIAMRGTHSGTYRGFPATHAIHELAIVGHFEIAGDGLIRTETAYYDQMAAAVALGALPDLQRRRGRLWLLAVRPGLLLRRLRALAGARWGR